MDKGYHAEKWVGRLLLGCGIGFMVLISVFSISLINDPSNARNPLLVGGFVGGFMVLGAPLGGLITILQILRWRNRRKSKQSEAAQFHWMHTK